MIYIDVRLFTQPLNGTTHTHQVAVGIFASTRTDVMYTMGFFKPKDYAKSMGLFVRGSPLKISQRMVRTNVNFPQKCIKKGLYMDFNFRPSRIFKRIQHIPSDY